MLAAPLYRIAAAHWPEPIVEQVYPDGHLNLRESLPTFGDDAVVRSRPLNAARIEFESGEYVLGYVVAIRAGEGASRKPPEAMVWRPGGKACELAFKAPGQAVEWVSCKRVSEISQPNRMHLAARIKLAFSRALPGVPVH